MKKSKLFLCTFLCNVLVVLSVSSTVLAASDKDFGNQAISQEENIDYLSPEELKDVIETDRMLKELGYVEMNNERTSNDFQNSDYYASNPNSRSSEPMDGDCDFAYWTTLGNIQTRVCVVSKLYTKSTVENSTTAIRNYLKIGYNLTIGFGTKIIWPISTILGLDSSIFDVNTGDSLVITEQKCFNYYYYKVYNNESKMWEIACSTIRVEEQVTTQYSTKDSTGHPLLLKEGERSETFFSRYYYDTAWKTECARQKQFGLVGSYDDRDIIY